MPKNTEKTKTVPTSEPEKKKISALSKFLRFMIVVLSFGIIFLYTLPLYKGEKMDFSFPEILSKNEIRPSSAPISEEKDLPTANESQNPPSPLPETQIESQTTPVAPIEAPKVVVSCGEQKDIIKQTVALYALMNRGQPFANELDALLVKDPQNPFGIAVQNNLADFATTGIATLPALQQMFQQAANEALYTFHVQKEMTWQEKVMGFLKSLVQVRPVVIKDVSGANIIYKAQDAINAGLIDEAVVTLSLLPPVQSFIMQPFIHEANGRMILDNISLFPNTIDGENE